MSEFFTLLVRGAEEGWVWMYTAGMPESSRNDRTAELESDAWENEQHANERGERFGLQLLYRFVFGIPADIGWRVGRGGRGFDRSSSPQLMIAVLLTIGLSVCLPVSLLLSPRAASDGWTPVNFALAADTLFCILALVLPGVFAIERWPVAGGLLICVGCLCLASIYLWLSQALVIIVFGFAACIVGMVRLRRMQSRR